MPLQPKKRSLGETCPFCGKPAREVGRDIIGDQEFILLECSHTIIRDVHKGAIEYEMVSSDGRRPYPFQEEGVKFIETQANYSGMILDEQGLGKTIQACLLVMRNLEATTPCLVVVKSGLRAQWFAEMFRWTGLAAQVITSSKEMPYFEFFKIVIVSIDTLRLLRPDCKPLTEADIMRLKAAKKRVPNQDPVWTDEVCAQFKMVIVDESHKIKNEGSSRTKALQLMVGAYQRVEKVPAVASLDAILTPKSSSPIPTPPDQWVPASRPKLLMLSGTNIEKHAGEFFVTLNLCRPEMFYSKAAFLQQWCEMRGGRVAGISNPERWKEYTSHFIIRRTRANVMPDLPKVQRNFRLVELEGDELKAYIKLVKEFTKATEDPEVKLSQSDILGYMSRLRHITGIAKVDAAVRYLEEFLLESDRKIVVFLHHQLAGAILLEKLNRLCKYGDADLACDLDSNPKLEMNIFAPPLYLHSGLNAYTERPALVEEFRKGPARIMLASTLASAEGLNMQFCQDCLFLERQWNPSTEEQAESRFPRPRPEDPWPADVKIMAHYLIAAGTIDDFFTEIVEGKRRNVKQTLDGEEMIWDEKNLMVELSKALREKGLSKWRL